MQSLTFGRPTIFHSESTDCELPLDHDAIIEEDGTEVGSGKWSSSARVLLLTNPSVALAI